MEIKIFFKRNLKYIALLFLCNIFFNSLYAQGFLKAEGKKIVNAKGHNVLLRGEGLGGWMLQEGYMLGINKDAQQNKIRSRIEDLMGPKETEEFYDAWLHNEGLLGSRSEMFISFPCPPGAACKSNMRYI